MHQNRRRKKRPNYGLRTVDILRGSNGFGFTISGQQPCILSCIVTNSPADQAGLRAGDFLISVNGISVSKMAHDAVVSLIGNCIGPIKMTIAENYYSDSSDEELECGRMMVRKPKYMHKPRQYRRPHKGIVEDKSVAKLRDSTIKPSAKPCSSNVYNNELDLSRDLNNSMPGDEEAGPIEYKALVGYLGTIEMPKQLLPKSRLQTVCSCIRKLRQEKRTPTTVLMTILPTCLTLKNSSNHIIAIYPTNRVVYVASSTDKDSRYFGLVTSAVCNNRVNSCEEGDISNSCHVFVIDPKISQHLVHLSQAETFKILCTQDTVTGQCLEFPQNALYIVNLIQTMYKLQNEPKNDINPVMANSPQPSASSNSDSGIGYRDDCGNISDRILVVEFPTHRPLPVMNKTNRPQGIDGGDLSLNAFDLNLMQPVELNNKSPYKQNNGNVMNNLNNIRAFDNIKNHFDNPGLLQKHNNHDMKEDNRLHCRALPPSPPKSNGVKYGDVDSGQTYIECPIDVPITDLSAKECFDMEFLPSVSVDDISAQSSKSADLNHIFRVPVETRKAKKQSKRMSSCDNIDKYNKLSPKVYGVSKTNYSCEELSNSEMFEEKFCYGSLQDLTNNLKEEGKRRTIAQSEPELRIDRNADNLCDQNGGVVKGSSTDGATLWATSFEKLLEDPIGLHAFAEFLKKEFSAENIYFWTACERYRRLTSLAERSSEAQKIFKQHLSSGAIEAVNVDAQGRQAAELGLRQSSADIFDIAQKQIFNLMKFDSYPRFLKSQLYKQCLNGEIVAPSFDARLSLQNPSDSMVSTPSKLKKSLSNAEDRRRKSLLPWARKNSSQRSKSRERNDMVTQRSWDGVLSTAHEDNRRLICENDMHSSHSSLTSLDLASQDNLRHDMGECRTALCRVLLSNGSTTVVQIKDDETIKELIDRLLEKRGLTYSSYEVYTNKHPKALDISECSIKLAGCEVTIEQRVIFKLDLPNKKIISVKSKYTKFIIDVLRPILHKYKFTLEQVTVTKAGYPVDITLPVTTIDNVRLNIQLKEETYMEAVNPVIKINNVKINKLEEITNKVFEGILQEKSEEVFKAPKSDKGSVKSEDWGSEHSSGLLGKFLRRESIHEKKKKMGNCQKPKALSDNKEDSEGAHKKPLIAKLKAGANKLHVGACSESDELVEGLTRAQRRLEDQRGTEINFELPDFLKDKDNERQIAKSNIALPKNQSPNYENQSVTGSPRTESVIAKSPENPVLKSPRTEPPPLPPKPKIIPIKPPNWGQSSFHKAKEVPLEKHELFLEQPSSSFV